MKFENTEVWGFEHAMRGMRNPKNSWHLNDTREERYINAAGSNRFNKIKDTLHICRYEYYDAIHVTIGPNDMRLAQTLIAGGSEHRKFMRQIFVSVDITAPLYLWKEIDTYKVGTVANSTSTMHKLTSKPITLDCFETDDIDFTYCRNFITEKLIPYLENLRQQYLETKDKKYWKELVRWLPESWLQTRTITMSYENIRTMIHQRGNHKLNEWSGKDNSELENFIKWAHTLPYADELLFWEPEKPKSKKEQMIELLFSKWDDADIVKEFKKFNIDLLDNDGKMKPILTIITELSNVWSDIDKT